MEKAKAISTKLDAQIKKLESYRGTMRSVMDELADTLIIIMEAEKYILDDAVETLEAIKKDNT